ncbi:hypothetical protein ACHAXA_007212 [Cyclostephanos tholiformis]|uniref:Alpha/beta hydrolase n=1 Tax=Cyclostephanos tholiformis TaxID=382380 RepID=A0ABD3SG52_9STRA
MLGWKSPPSSTPTTPPGGIVMGKSTNATIEYSINLWASMGRIQSIIRCDYVINFLIFDNRILLRYALDNVLTRELLGDALRSLYTCSPDRVNGELVDSFYYPAKLGGEGAVEAIRQIYTNDAGLTPMEYHRKYPDKLDSLPLHLIWGLEDSITPINGDVGLFYCDRVANNRGGNGRTTIDVVKSGHMPFNDNPIETHKAMLRWLEKKVL